MQYFSSTIFQDLKKLCWNSITSTTTSDFTSITSHIYNRALFSLWLNLFILSEIFLQSSPAAYWTPTYVGSSSFTVISFCFFITFKGFSRQEYLSDLPFPSPMNHILSEFSTMTHLSWALHSIAHSFIELDKAVIQVISLVSFL